jgi:uncharacterized protein (TIGR00251 family)
VSARFAVRVQPGARRSSLRGWRADGALGLAVTVPPEGGRANVAVVRLLGEALGVPPRDITVVRGHHGRAKLIEVRGIEQRELEQRLERALEESGGDHGK